MLTLSDKRKHKYENIWNWGAGGFGREVMPVAQEILAKAHPKKNYLIYFVSEYVSEETNINGLPLVSEEKFLSIQSNEKNSIFQYPILKHGKE